MLIKVVAHTGFQSNVKTVRPQPEKKQTKKKTSTEFSHFADQFSIYTLLQFCANIHLISEIRQIKFYTRARTHTPLKTTDR